MTMTEKQLDNEILKTVASLRDWAQLVAYHTRNSYGSAHGFPDWVFAGAGGIMYRECKTQTGTLRPDQSLWRDILLSQGADWALWRPDDYASGRVNREICKIAGLNPGR